MAKKITDFKNPLTMTSGSVLDASTWLGGILFVVMFGMIVAMGTAALNVIDRKVPGQQSPNMKPYGSTIVDDGISVL